MHIRAALEHSLLQVKDPFHPKRVFSIVVYSVPKQREKKDGAMAKDSLSCQQYKM